ncbi:hypothetical protein GM182_07750 [bacterium 3DAC]|nr:hypothetical protein GM182_07750 [bacterium 3DAC]
MRKFIIIFMVLSLVFYIPAIHASVKVYKGSTIQLDMKGQYIEACNNFLVVAGTKKVNGKLYRAVALLDLSNPDKPSLIKEAIGSDKDVGVPVTDVVCAKDTLYVLRNNAKNGPWLGVEAWSMPSLTPIDVSVNMKGLTGLYVGEKWKYKSGVYFITPFSGDGLLWFYDGQKHKVDIDDSGVPTLARTMSYLQRIFQLSSDTLLLIGQGAYVVKMTDALHGKVISYVNVDVTSGGEPVYFGYRAQMVADTVIGWYPDGEPTGFYFYDIKKKKAYYKEYSVAEQPDKLSSFGNYFYALVRPGESGYKSLFILNVRSGDVGYQALDREYRDIAAYMGRVYLLSADNDQLTVYDSPLFIDMGPDYWAYGAAAFLISQGVISGYPDGSFKPDKEVTRAEYAKMLATSLKLDIAKCNGFHVFKDVKDSDWFCPYVQAVNKAGYMVGYGKGKFAPQAMVKKEEILTTIVRIKGWQLERPKTPTFDDITSDYWAYPYVETAVRHGIIGPNDEGLTKGRHFGKGSPSTRAQTAVLIYRGIYGKR